MITGLLAEVTGKELKEQANSKSKYYKGLQEKIKIEIATEKEREKEGLISEGMGSKVGNIIVDLEARMKTCKNKEQYFTFMSAHSSDDVYRLTQTELVSFEFIENRY